MDYHNLKFQKDSLFLVTGGAGFIGSNLCEAILEMGYKVRCLDDLSTGNINNIAALRENKNFDFIKGDIKHYDTCDMACKGVDYVLHQAAWGCRQGDRRCLTPLPSSPRSGACAARCGTTACPTAKTNSKEAIFHERNRLYYR